MPDDVVLEERLSVPLASSEVFAMCVFILEPVCKLLPARADVRDGFTRAAAKS